MKLTAQDVADITEAIDSVAELQSRSGVLAKSAVFETRNAVEFTVSYDSKVDEVVAEVAQ